MCRLRCRKYHVCPVEFDRINPMVRAQSKELLAGCLVGVDSGKWSDFTTRAHGDDLVDLVAHLVGIAKRDEVRPIAASLSIELRVVPDVGGATGDVP